MRIGGSSGVPSKPESDDMRDMVGEGVGYCEDEDRREPMERGGVAPPSPFMEFIEAFRSRLGVEDRESIGLELAVGRSGLRGGFFAFGEGGTSRCAGLLGDSTCGEGGRAVAEAVDSERCLNDSRSAASSLFLFGGRGAAGGTPAPSVSTDIGGLILCKGSA